MGWWTHLVSAGPRHGTAGDEGGSGMQGRDRRQDDRYPTSIRLSFRMAGRTHVGRTLDISVHGATLLTPVRVPPGAMLVLDVLDGPPEAEASPDGLRLVASVIRSGPAPAGHAEKFLAGLRLIRAAGPTWGALARFAHESLHADAGSVRRSTGERPAFDLRNREQPSPDTSGGLIDVLYGLDGVWYRGSLVSAAVNVLWVATGTEAPPLHALVRLNVGVRIGGERMALIVVGRVEHPPYPDPEGRGWIFAVDAKTVNGLDLFSGLLKHISGTE